jgi:hypothetical protein
MPAGLFAAVLIAGCTTASPSPTADLPETTRSASPSANASGAPAPSEGTAMIPQPDTGDIEVADASARVDLAMPTFSNPTEITNPYFPVKLGSATLLVGTVDDKPFRTETTVLPTTRVVDWAGQRIETVVSQYAAFLDGRVHEIAYDLYAQADDGSVWYFGEDVFNFADGAIVDTHGTWHAGVDGLAAMIMPADPAEGDVYRPENIPGLVFEEVVVLAADETVDGPFGPIDGAIVVEEHHTDGATEEKIFAPGYGEFYTAADGEVEALAMAIPTDAGSETPPAALETLRVAANDAVDAALANNLDRVHELASDLESAAEDLGESDVPALLRPLLDDAIAALADAGEAAEATDAAIDAARLAGDLGLRYRPVAEVDLDRIGLWGAQLIADAKAENLAGVNATKFALGYARERILADAPDEAVAELTAALEELQTAVEEADFDLIAEIGESIRSLTHAR